MRVIVALAYLSVVVLARPEAGQPYRTILHFHNGRGDEYRRPFQAPRPHINGQRFLRSNAPRGAQGYAMYGPPPAPAPAQHANSGHSLDLPTGVTFGSPITTGGQASYFKGGPAPVPAFPAPAPLQAQAPLSTSVPVQAPAPVQTYAPAAAPVQSYIPAPVAAPTPAVTAASVPVPEAAPAQRYLPAPVAAPTPAATAAPLPVPAAAPAQGYLPVPVAAPVPVQAPSPVSAPQVTQPCHTVKVAADTPSAGPTMLEVVQSVSHAGLENAIASGLMGYAQGGPTMMALDVQPRIVSHGGQLGYAASGPSPPAPAVMPVQSGGVPDGYMGYPAMAPAQMQIGGSSQGAAVTLATGGVAQDSSASSGSDNGLTVVHKHLYVHMPPEEPADVVPSGPATASAGPVQKHYKIIFIKAPSYSQQLAQQQAAVAAAQAQEKTLVYVLSKTPNGLTTDPVTGEAEPAYTPSKPEVYFIKYKAPGGEASAGEVISNAMASGGTMELESSVGASVGTGGIGDFNLPQYPSVYGVPS